MCFSFFFPFFWFINIIWIHFILINLMKSCICVDLTQFIGNDSFIPTIIIFLDYGLAVAASTYCLTFFFSDHTVAQVCHCWSSLWLNLPKECSFTFHCSILSAECGFTGALFWWTHPYGYFICNGAYWGNEKCEFCAKG